jgi:hypothetical protein
MADFHIAGEQAGEYIQLKRMTGAPAAAEIGKVKTYPSSLYRDLDKIDDKGIIRRASGLPTGYIDGLGVTWSSTTTVTLAAGRCRNSSDIFDIVLPSSDVIDDTVATDRDFVPAANQWIYIHVIADTNGVNATRGFFSLSDTAPTLPGGYDVFRRVGVVRNSAAAVLVEVQQVGSGRLRLYLYYNLISTRAILVGGVAVVATAVSAAAFVPPTSFNAILHVRQSGPVFLFLYRTAAGAVVDGLLAFQEFQVNFPLDGTQSLAYANFGAGGNASIWAAGFWEVV